MRVKKKERKGWQNSPGKTKENRLRRLSGRRKSRRRLNCQPGPHRRGQKKPANHPTKTVKSDTTKKREKSRKDSLRLLNPADGHRRSETSAPRSTVTERADQASAKHQPPTGTEGNSRTTPREGSAQGAAARRRESRSAQTPGVPRTRGPQGTLRWSRHRSTSRQSRLLKHSLSTARASLSTALEQNLTFQVDSIVSAIIIVCYCA